MIVSEDHDKDLVSAPAQFQQLEGASYFANSGTSLSAADTSTQIQASSQAVLLCYTLSKELLCEKKIACVQVQENKRKKEEVKRQK